MKFRRIISFLGILFGVFFVLYYFPKELAWLNTQYGLLITISVSVLIPWLTSERWVEQYRLKREHSVKLAEESLWEWRHKINDFTEIKSIPNTDTYIYEAIESPKPSTISYFTYLEEHLKTGHSLIIELWSNLEANYTRINEYKASILESIRQIIVNDDYLDGLELTKHHLRKSRVHRIQPPLQYYSPDEITESIFDEIEYLLQYNQHQHSNIFGVTPTNMETEEGYLQTYELKYNVRLLFRTLNNDNIQILKGWFNSLSEREELINQVENLHKEISLLDELKEEFIKKVDELIWYVQLGNNLKGNCPYCPPGTLTAIVKYFFD